MAEQFAFKQCLGDGAHIYRDHSLFFAVRQHMYFPCQHFLTSSVLSGDQDIGVCFGNLFDQVAELLHGVAFAPEHAAFLGDNLLAAFMRNSFPVCHPDIVSRFQRFQQFRIVPRFDNEVGGAFLDAPYCQVYICIGGEEYDLYGRVFLLYFGQPEKPLVTGVDSGTEIHIQQDYVHITLTDEEDVPNVHILVM